MTKSEAIELLKEYATRIKPFYEPKRTNYAQAIDLAIEALRTDIVRCKDCIHRQTDKCPMYHEEWYTIDEGDGYFSDAWDVYDYTVDDGYCHLGDTEKGENNAID